MITLKLIIKLSAKLIECISFNHNHKLPFFTGAGRRPLVKQRSDDDDDESAEEEEDESEEEMEKDDEESDSEDDDEDTGFSEEETSVKPFSEGSLAEELQRGKATKAQLGKMMVVIHCITCMYIFTLINSLTLFLLPY